MNKKSRKRIVIGVTGASGIIYAERLIEVLSPVAELHFVISSTAVGIAKHEGISFDLSDVTVYENNNLAAAIASGSFRHDGMVIVPCSMNTLASVSTGITTNLITRAADVSLKEHRCCILLLRENPLSRTHIQNMLQAHDAGATIMTASPPFYHRPKSIEELVDAVIARIVDQLNINIDISPRWSGYNA